MVQKKGWVNLVKFIYYSNCKVIELEPECTPDKLKYHETKRMHGKGKRDGSDHSYVNEEVIEIVKKYFRPHMRRLQKLSNNTLSWMPS